ncbi:MAG: Icc-related predicted phosphoesterase [Desulforhopalus sp.]|jgi:Icc-related predicted phosphoesterase
MRIIAVGDIHMAPEHLNKIPDIDKVDLVLLNGDLTNYGGVKEVRQVLNHAMALNPNTLAHFGNLDKAEINTYLEDLGINLHGQARLINNSVCIVGIGGSNITPFLTPSEFSESDLRTIAENAYLQGIEYVRLAEPLHKKKIPIILVSHAPPHNTRLDKIRSGKHVGSKAIRTVIEKHQPALSIVGHIHEGKGEDTIINSPIINPGMLRNGGWVLIEVKNSELHTQLQ